MLREIAAALLLVSGAVNSAALPEPKNKIAFNNFSKVLTDFFIKDEIASIKNGKEGIALDDTYGPYSAEEMYRDYKQNELVANKKYKGKRNRILDTVDSVTENFLGQAVVKTVSPNYFLGGAMLDVDKEDPYVLNLVPGSKVDMVCNGRGFVMDSPVLDKCVSTESYAKTQLKENPKIKKKFDAFIYYLYIPNEDVLGKECNTIVSCNEFVSIIALLVEGGKGDTKKDFTDDEKKKVIRLVEKYNFTKDSMDELSKKMKNFMEKHKDEFEKRFGVSGDSKS